MNLWIRFLFWFFFGIRNLRAQTGLSGGDQTSQNNFPPDKIIFCLCVTKKWPIFFGRWGEVFVCLFFFRIFYFFFKFLCDFFFDFFSIFISFCFIFYLVFFQFQFFFNFNFSKQKWEAKNSKRNFKKKITSQMFSPKTSLTRGPKRPQGCSVQKRH